MKEFFLGKYSKRISLSFFHPPQYIPYAISLFTCSCLKLFFYLKKFQKFQKEISEKLISHVSTGILSQNTFEPFHIIIWGFENLRFPDFPLQLLFLQLNTRVQKDPVSGFLCRHRHVLLLQMWSKFPAAESQTLDL